MSEKSKKAEKKSKKAEKKTEKKAAKTERKERKPMRFRRDHLKVIGLLAKDLPKRSFVKISAIAKLFKDGEKITADRVARNSVRKPVSEGLIERGEGEDRGNYRLSPAGASFAKDMDEYEVAPDRGEGGKKTKGKKAEKKAPKKSGKAKPAAKSEKAPKKAKKVKKSKKAKVEKTEKADKEEESGLDLPTGDDERTETTDAESETAESPESESAEESVEAAS